MTKPQLWPSDHGYVSPVLKVYATDPSGAAPTISVKVYSDEPDDQDPADGNLWPDVLLAQSPPTFRLRAERRSAGDGRVYLVQAIAQGPNGTASDCLSVVVPLTNVAPDPANVAAEAAAAVSYCDANGAAPAGYTQIAEGAYVVAALDQRVKPIVECVVPMGGNQYLAVYGYQNDNPLPATVGIGDDNKFAPLPVDRGQPIRFTPGHSPLVEGAFAFPFAGSSQTWSLRGPDGTLRTANASSNSAHCAFTPAVPVAADDTAATAVDTPVAIPVLVNDSDPQSQPLSVARVTAPTHGTAVIETDGTVTYTPSAGYAGTDAFTYVASDGAYGTDVATVTVTISGATNQAPAVDAGADQAITLPATASLAGAATDDGLPTGSTLAIAWSQDSGPGTVSFAPVDAVTSTATFSTAGTYVLRLAASDSALSASDTVTVVVTALVMPEISIGDVTVAEGHAGRTTATATVTLSAATGAPVTVRYRTDEGTATACDYEPAAGDLSFAPGQTTATIAVSVVGELLPEADETFTIGLGDPTGAAIADGVAVVTVTNDDVATNPPSAPGSRTPAHGAVGLTIPPTLAWTATDPDGDALTYDVSLGTALDPTGQQWTEHCPATAGPSARDGAASAYDDASDRLIVFGGSTQAGETAELWVLANATGLGGTPAWSQLAPAGGPSARQRAAVGYDAATNQLVVSGGCASGCTAALADTWVLSNANGLGGPPTWASRPAAPAARYGQASAFLPGTKALVVYGGSSGGEVHGNYWILRNATGPGVPQWFAELPVFDRPPREGASLVYDAAGDRLFLWGGRDASGAASNVGWRILSPSAANNTSWQQLFAPGVVPGARAGHAAVYDATTRRMLVAQGAGTPPAGTALAARDVWTLEQVDPAGVYRWTRIEPDGATAPGRALAAVAYSPSRARLVAFGGRDDRATPERLGDLWTLTDPIGRLPLASAGQSAASYTLPASDPGATYYWRVVARDTHGAANGAPVWTFAPNRPPVVDAGPFHEVVLPQDTITVQGSVTDDGVPSPAAVTTQWSAHRPHEVVFASPDRLDTAVTFTAPGTHVLTLSATDGAATATDTAVVFVRANEPPVVGAGEDRTVQGTLRVQLDGFAADDGLPSVAFTTTWTQVSGPGLASFDDATSLDPLVTFERPGEYVLALTADDGELTSADEVTITAASFADLKPLSIDTSLFEVEDQTLEASGTLAAAVTNLGGDPGASFQVTFYDDRNGNGQLEPLVDGLLATATLEGLAAGGTATVTAPVSGAVAFAGNVVHVRVDSEDAITESDETNNQASSLECETAPALPASTSTPALKWSVAPPSAPHVLSTPVVADLDQDGTPEIVFPSYGDYTPEGLVVDGRLNAVNGRTGALVFSVAGADDAHTVAVFSQVAVGNLDDDGFLEIVGVNAPGTRLIAFEHTGAVKWLSDVIQHDPLGGVALADLDGDGNAEIVIGRQVLDRHGQMLWRDEQQAGTGPFGSLSVVADVDQDGSLDVIAGNTAYHADGSVLWQDLELGDGFNAVADLDSDGAPEVVLVADGWVYALRGVDGEELWRYAIGDGGHGGPPTIADLHVGPGLEIGVAGRTSYVVLRPDGTPLWTSTIEDLTSHVTGSTVFDLDGDGLPEVIYADEEALRIYAGASGTVLYQAPLGSCTGYELPVVADVDGDGAAEILTGANSTGGNCPELGTAGLFVFGEPTWAGARRIWNQHSYHVTNVLDDGSIPVHEQPGWHDSYRRNRQVQGCAYARPDLVPSFAEAPEGPAGVTVRARIGNGGGRAVPAGVTVTFYDRDPAGGGLSIGTAVTPAPILPEAFLDVTLTVPSTTVLDPLWVVADTAAVVAESDETNNAYNARLFWNGTANVPPSVDAGADQLLSAPGTAALDGDATDDGLPSALRTTWRTVSGPGPAVFANAQAIDTTATFALPGTYVLRLRADDGHDVASDTVQIEVEPVNQAPLVDAGPDLESPTGLIGTEASVTDDGLPVGAPLTFEWSQIDGPVPVSFSAPDELFTVVHATAAGVYVLRLTASDSALAASSDVTLTVTAVQNRPPVVSAGPDRTTALSAPTITLSGTATDDGLPEGSTLAVSWQQLSGPAEAVIASPHAAVTAVTFDTPGRYSLRLVATDGALSVADEVLVDRRCGRTDRPGAHRDPHRAFRRKAHRRAGAREGHRLQHVARELASGAPPEGRRSVAGFRLGHDVRHGRRAGHAGHDDAAERHHGDPPDGDGHGRPLRGRHDARGGEGAAEGRELLGFVRGHGGTGRGASHPGDALVRFA